MGIVSFANGARGIGWGLLVRLKNRGKFTLTHALAASASAYRTLATPSGSLSKSTTLVTSPTLAHSSRMSSLISSIAAGSSCERWSDR